MRNITIDPVNMNNHQVTNLASNEGKKILMIIGGLGAGGKERQLIALLKWIKQAGNYSPYLAVLNPKGLRELEVTQYAEKVIKVKRFFKLDLVLPILHLIYLCKKERFQLVHTWGSGIWDLSGFVVAKVCWVPLLHGGIRSSPTQFSISNRLSKWSASRADAIVANSMAGLTAFGLRNHPRAAVIYNGVELNRFAGLNRESSNYTLCMVANFSNKKDHRTLISALPIVIHSFPDVHLTLIGQDAGTLDEILSLVTELNIKKHVTFFTDTLDPEPYVAKSQICILSTYGEGISNALLEYMALSKPVIATDVSGNKEVVIQQITGLLVPPGNPPAMAEKIIELLNNPIRAKEMGNAGYAVLNSKFSIEKMGSAYEELFGRLIN